MGGGAEEGGAAEMWDVGAIVLGRTGVYRETEVSRVVAQEPGVEEKTDHVCSQF